MKELISAAQLLTNTSFNKASDAIIGKARHHLAQPISVDTVRQIITKSVLSHKDKKCLSSATDEAIRLFARDIVLSLAKKELKNPLNPPRK